MSFEPAPPSDIAISVRSVGKEYRVFSRPHQRVLEPILRRLGSDRRLGLSVKAVDDISFDLARRDTLAIIGRNGSGKSTLLEMITGTLSPTSGESIVQGRISALLELGAGFNPDFTGRQNYRLNASILGLTDDEIAETEPYVEAFAELDYFMDEPVRTYSSGMYVRLAFATAVHVKPDILIVDEALAVGDVFFQQKCFEFLENELADVTKLLVTHDLAMAAKLADRCIVMDEGKLVFDGDTLDGIQAYTAISLRRRNASESDQPVELPEVEQGDQVPVSSESASSPGLFRIASISASQADPATKVSVPLRDQPWICRSKHEIQIDLEAVIGQEVESPVLGYLVRDRLGNAVFGENSLGSQIALEPMSAGAYRLTLAFPWPEVAPGDYTLTIGLGDGLHTHFHQIVGWVQGVASMTSVPDRPFHGIVNTDITSRKVIPRESRTE